MKVEYFTVGMAPNGVTKRFGLIYTGQPIQPGADDFVLYGMGKRPVRIIVKREFVTYPNFDSEQLITEAINWVNFALPNLTAKQAAKGD